MTSNANPHSSALRKGRSSEKGRVYAITKCTHNRELLFWPGGSGAQAAGAVVQALQAVQQLRGWNLIACVIMPDHIHAVVQLDGDELARVVKLFSMKSTRAVNGVLQRKGPVWQGSFYDHALRGPASLRAHLQYMAMNPVRAGLVNSPEEWPFRFGLP